MSVKFKKPSDLTPAQRTALEKKVNQSINVFHEGLAQLCDTLIPEELEKVHVTKFPNMYAWLAYYDTGTYSLHWIDNKGYLNSIVYDEDTEKWERRKLS